MNEQFAMLASVWNWRPTIIFPLLLFLYLFTTGWIRLRRRSRAGGFGFVTVWRLTLYWVGLLCVAAALLSPIEILSSWLFIYHMIQHLLLMMLGPPLMLFANPMPFLLWGLPAGMRKAAGRGLGKLLHRESGSRTILRQVTHPAIVWFFYIGTIIIWHDPNMYDAALTHGWVHDLEHIMFFGSAMLFWWLATGAGPRVHKQFGLIGRIGFVISALPANWFIGVSLALATEPTFTHYAAMGRIGVSVMEDQIAGGFIMWVPGSMMYVIFALILVARLVSAESDKPALRHIEMTKDGKMLAPGVEQRRDQ